MSTNAAPIKPPLPSLAPLLSLRRRRRQAAPISHRRPAVLQPFEDDSVTSVEHHCSILVPLSFPCTHAPPWPLFVPYSAAKRAPRSLPGALRRPKPSSRRPPSHLEAIEDFNHAFELAVLFCIPSVTSSPSPSNRSSPSTYPWPYLAGNLATPVSFSPPLTPSVRSRSSGSNRPT
jgi:hypothetical protein